MGIPDTTSAQSVPWPIAINGITVSVTDSQNVSRSAGLVMVSPHQINFEVPVGTEQGTARITASNGLAQIVSVMKVQPVAPSLYRINEAGVAAATAFRRVIPSYIDSVLEVFHCLDTPESCVLVPINVGLDAPVYLSFYGTGIRNRSSLD